MNDFIQVGTSSNSSNPYLMGRQYTPGDTSGDPNARLTNVWTEKLNKLRESVLASGAEADEVDAIINRAFFEAAQGDKDDRWVFETVRPKLRAINAKLHYEVEYSPNEDSAQMAPLQFMQHVLPRPDMYAGWDDAAADVVRSDFIKLMERVADLRLGAGRELVVVETVDKRSRSGYVRHFGYLAEAVACIVADVQVLFQVRMLSGKEAKELSKELSKMGKDAPPKEDYIADLLKRANMQRF